MSCPPRSSLPRCFTTRRPTWSRRRPSSVRGSCGSWVGGSWTSSLPRSVSSTRPSSWPPRSAAPNAGPAWSASDWVTAPPGSPSTSRTRAATRLRTYLEAFTSPRHQGAGEGDRIPVDRKRGQAFCALLEVIDPKRLPAHGGDATTLIVTVSLDDLRKDLGTAELGPADKLTAGEARRLACTAQIIPAVLDGKSEVLDLGRSSTAVQTRPAQGDDHPRPGVPRRGLHHPRGLVRGPPLGQTLGRRWPHRPEGRRTPLQLAPPPSTRLTYDSSRLPNGDVRFSRRT